MMPRRMRCLTGIAEGAPADTLSACPHSSSTAQHHSLALWQHRYGGGYDSLGQAQRDRRDCDDGDDHFAR